MYYAMEREGGRGAEHNKNRSSGLHVCVVLMVKTNRWEKRKESIFNNGCFLSDSRLRSDIYRTRMIINAQRFWLFCFIKENLFFLYLCFPSLSTYSSDYVINCSSYLSFLYVYDIYLKINDRRYWICHFKSCNFKLIDM